MTMEDYINSSRPAFHTAVNAINREDKEALMHLTNQALNILYSPESVTGNQVLSGLCHIYRGAKLKNVAGNDDLSDVLKKTTGLSAQSVECITSSWREYVGNRAGIVEDDVKNVGVGRFAGLEWKLGVATESNNCKRLGKPFVSLIIHVAANNKTVAHHVEMDIEEFQKFRGGVKSMQDLLDTL